MCTWFHLVYQENEMNEAIKTLHLPNKTKRDGQASKKKEKEER